MVMLDNVCMMVRYEHLNGYDTIDNILSIWIKEIEICKINIYVQY